MSGTTSASIVGVKRWQLAEPLLDRRREREGERVHELERVVAHHDDELRLDDVQLPRQL